MSMRRILARVGQILICAFLAILVARAENVPEQKNMVLVSHTDLNGHGDAGEGMMLQQWPDGRRILYFAHGARETCLSIVDVTNPSAPSVINELPSPNPGVTRCNSVGLSGNVLAVANETRKTGETSAGVWVLDVSDFERIRKAHSLKDLAFSFFDASGPRSNGVHWLWFVDGEFIHFSADAGGYLVVDVRDRQHPREVSRWWPAGPQLGEYGIRLHSVAVYPDHPNRAYAGYMDGGQYILDISGLSEVRAGRADKFTPTVISRTEFSPPFPGSTHAVQPIFNRGLSLAIDEAHKQMCEDSPKFVWLVDIHTETSPLVMETAPFPENARDLCKRGGRSGTHDLALEHPGSTSAHLKNSFVGAFMNAGVRVYRLVDAPVPFPNAPPRIEEVGYYIPAAPPGNSTHTIQINGVLVDEKGLIYASDEFTGGLYILKYTGTVPLD